MIEVSAFGTIFEMMVGTPQEGTWIVKDGSAVTTTVVHRNRSVEIGTCINTKTFLILMYSCIIDMRDTKVVGNRYRMGGTIDPMLTASHCLLIHRTIRTCVVCALRILYSIGIFEHRWYIDRPDGYGHGCGNRYRMGGTIDPMLTASHCLLIHKTIRTCVVCALRILYSIGIFEHRWYIDRPDGYGHGCGNRYRMGGTIDPMLTASHCLLIHRTIRTCVVCALRILYSIGIFEHRWYIDRPDGYGHGCGNRYRMGGTIDPMLTASHCLLIHRTIRTCVVCALRILYSIGIFEHRWYIDRPDGYGHGCGNRYRMGGTIDPMLTASHCLLIHRTIRTCVVCALRILNSIGIFEYRWYIDRPDGYRHGCGNRYDANRFILTEQPQT
ncbi:hypothetical protein J6590_074344 [Homalodisca vitripennis]|nr:hypothetical protein J6590_074344 [Homalodisca vitripennis]